MPPIAYLESLRRSESGGCGIGIGSIPANDFDRGISLEPGSHRSRFPIRQEIQSTMPFQITDQRPVAMPTTPRPIIEADDTGWLKGLIEETAKQTQERVWATTHPQDRREARALFSPESQSKALQHLFESNGPARTALG